MVGAAMLGSRHDAARGERIEALRRERGLTQAAVATRVGASVRSYGHWKAGEPISFGNLHLLARTLGTTPEALDGQDVVEPPGLVERVSRLEGAVEALSGAVERLLAQAPAGPPEAGSQSPPSAGDPRSTGATGSPGEAGWRGR